MNALRNLDWRHTWFLLPLLCGGFVSAPVKAGMDPSLTKKAQAVETKEQRHRADVKRLQKQRLAAAEKTVASLGDDVPEAQRRLEDARHDYHDLMVSSDGSFDRFNARLDADFSDIKVLVRNYRAE